MVHSENHSQIDVVLGAINGLNVVSLKNEFLSVSFLPELGGKMISLKSLETGREFLLQPPERPYRRATYGASFADFDTSGFDECFPSVSPCEHPQTGGMVPDHGELWSVPWQYEICGHELLLRVSGHNVPYTFCKRVAIEERRIILNYEVENTSEEPFAFLWSAHPLLAVSPGCRIFLPNEVKAMFVQWSHGDRLGKFGDTCGWPVACDSSGKPVDLAELKSIEERSADKLFTPRLNEGFCALYDPNSDESLTFEFDTASVPYVGVWICQGGWPTPDRGHFTLALEPCSGRPDSLADAVKDGSSQLLQARSKRTWNLTLQVGKGCPRWV